MTGLGTIVNTAAIVAGGLVGMAHVYRPLAAPLAPAFKVGLE